MRAGGGEFTSIYDTHNFVTKSFKRPTHCDFCSDLIWGLGREGVKCPGKERLRTLILFSGALTSFYYYFILFFSFLFFFFFFPFLSPQIAPTAPTASVPRISW